MRIPSCANMSSGRWPGTACRSSLGRDPRVSRNRSRPGALLQRLQQSGRLRGNRIVGVGQHVLAVDVDQGRLELFRLSFVRSEEHTSELQSLMRISYAVFCLKKKKT